MTDPTRPEGEVKYFPNFLAQAAAKVIHKVEEKLEELVHPTPPVEPVDPVVPATPSPASGVEPVVVPEPVTPPVDHPTA
jgi:hypothetical protein